MNRVCRQNRSLFVITVVVAAFAADRALGWDEEGHVVVTRIAFQSLPSTMPAWLRSPEVQARLEYLCAEPDRWRGINAIQVDHANSPEHYIDLEMLDPLGLKASTLPLLRRQFLDTLAEYRFKNPESEKSYDAAKDKEYVKRIPGLLPYTVAELQWKIASSWCTLRTFEKHRDHVSYDMIRNAREDIVYHMGIISHFVGDGSQPLHVTIHHHGWVGENPEGYTTNARFHQYIDGGVLAHHGITRERLPGPARQPVVITSDGYGRQIAQYLEATHDQLVPLYELDKSHDLDQERGRVFINDRLLAGGAMLSGIWIWAYEAPNEDKFLDHKVSTSPPTTQRAMPTSRPVATTQPSGD